MKIRADYSSYGIVCFFFAEIKQIKIIMESISETIMGTYGFILINFMSFRFFTDKPIIKLVNALKKRAAIILKLLKFLSITPKICIITDKPPKDAHAHMRAKLISDEPFSAKSVIAFDISIRQ